MTCRRVEMIIMRSSYRRHYAFCQSVYPAVSLSVPITRESDAWPGTLYNLGSGSWSPWGF